MAADDLYFAPKNLYSKGADVTVDQHRNFLDRGVDPKPVVMEFCKPLCHYWKARLNRCENKLREVIKVNPTKTCLYAMRDYVTCVEACVQPKIHNNLEGTS